MHYLFTVVSKYFQDGGIWIMIPIFLVSFIAWFLIVSKYFDVKTLKSARDKYLKFIENNSSIQIDEVHYKNLVEFHKLYNVSKKSYYNFYREFLIGVVPFIEQKFDTINSWISVSPLLGLLGTVSGMIETFKIITEFGLGNPNITAQGISIALITTQAGLFVAFPLLLFQNYVKNLAIKLKLDILKDGEQIIKRY